MARCCTTQWHKRLANWHWVMSVARNGRDRTTGYFLFRFQNPEVPWSQLTLLADSAVGWFQSERKCVVIYRRTDGNEFALSNLMCTSDLTRCMQESAAQRKLAAIGRMIRESVSTGFRRVLTGNLMFAVHQLNKIQGIKALSQILDSLLIGHCFIKWISRTRQFKRRKGNIFEWKNGTI